VRLTRRQLLVGGTAGAALGAAGVYELVDRLTDAPARHFGEGRAPEQHLLDGMRLADDNGVEIVVPTLHAVERYWRDARLTKIFEGTSEIQQRIISDHLLGKPKAA